MRRWPWMCWPGGGDIGHSPIYRTIALITAGFQMALKQNWTSNQTALPFHLDAFFCILHKMKYTVNGSRLCDVSLKGLYELNHLYPTFSLPTCLLTSLHMRLHWSVHQLFSTYSQSTAVDVCGEGGQKDSQQHPQWYNCTETWCGEWCSEKWQLWCYWCLSIIVYCLQMVCDSNQLQRSDDLHRLIFLLSCRVKS